MKKIFLAGLMLILPTTLLGASVVTDVTPANLADQPLRLSVESEERDNGEMWIRVSIGPGRSQMSGHVEGRLEILDGEELVVACNVEPDREKNGLTYSFGVTRRLVNKTVFMIRHFSRADMPSFDGYRIRVGDFVTN